MITLYLSLIHISPVFSALEVSGTDEKSFTVSTSILDEGGGEILFSGFCWKETSVSGYLPTEKDEMKVIDNLSDYRLRIKDLKPGRQYAVRAYSASTKGIGYGAVSYTHLGVKNLIRYQQNIAAESGIAFWNMFEAMGGEGSMAKLVHAKPSMANYDYTHINFRGGKHLAGLLYETLLYGKEQYDRRRAYENK